MPLMQDLNSGKVRVKGHGLEAKIFLSVGVCYFGSQLKNTKSGKVQFLEIILVVHVTGNAI